MICHEIKPICAKLFTKDAIFFGMCKFFFMKKDFLMGFVKFWRYS